MSQNPDAKTIEMFKRLNQVDPARWSSHFISLAVASLSGREREVLTLVSEGLSNKEIAARFGVSSRTIETHRLRLGKKLTAGLGRDVSTVPQFTKIALIAGLTKLDDYCR